MRIVGIQRSTTFSPGRHADNDRLILEATSRVLQRHGCSVDLMAEEDVGRVAISASAVFSMCQGSRANQILQGIESDGALIINPPAAAMACHRARLYHRLGQDRGVMVPTILVATQGEHGIPSAFRGKGSLWVKRGDVHATQRGDVVRVLGEEEYRATLRDFCQRGISEATVERHLEGEVVKFYGVVDSPFFRFYSESDCKICPVTFAAARPGIEQVVRRLGLEVYGGDAVVTSAGVVVIDVNDWPSFANFRAEAAEVIGNHIYRRAANHSIRQRLREYSGYSIGVEVPDPEGTCPVISSSPSTYEPGLRAAGSTDAR